MSAPGGCTWSQGCLLWGEGTWSGGCLLQGGGGSLLLCGVSAPVGVYLLLGGCLLPGVVCFGGSVPGPGGVYGTPPVNRMTNRCKNITLPQTSFAGGKNSAPLMSQTYS